MRTAAAADSPFALHDAERERLSRRLAGALAAARSTGRAHLASITVALPSGGDPAAVVCASRRAGEPWFVLEQPERGSRALAAVGEAVELRASGAGRFSALAARWRELAADAFAEPSGGSHAAGPLALGGLSFAPDGAQSPHWRGFGPASLVVPELSLARGERGGELLATMTLTALMQPDDDPDRVLERLLERLEGLRAEPLPLLDPSPTGR
ncbi:MAG: menaquinone-specific isochorismate synthase, partial [Solirubrobacteraceae bacterium]|nr:menaquinone-specific isochorismate synthase [Solirubrobacteraceae bacterium]